MMNRIKFLFFSLLLFGFLGSAQADNFEIRDDGRAILTLNSVDINFGEDVEEFTDLELELLPPGAELSSEDIAFRLRSESIRPDRVIHTRTILSAGSEVPPIQSAGAGVANLSVNLMTGEIKGIIEMDNMLGVVAAHAHQGTPGENGPVVFDLAGPRGNFLDDHFLLVPENTTLSEEQLAAFLRGDLYLNVHTATNPGGEIRGQINPGIIRVFAARLSGDQEVPPVTTDGEGFGVVFLNLRTGEIRGRVRIADIDAADVAAAHIHFGEAGENGDVIVDLADGIDGTTIMIPEGSMLTRRQVAAMIRGNTYFNVHTPTNPAGEIRGQINRVRRPR